MSQTTSYSFACGGCGGGDIEDILSPDELAEYYSERAQNYEREEETPKQPPHKAALVLA